MMRAFAVVVVRLSAGVVLLPGVPPPSTSSGVVVSTPEAVTMPQDTCIDVVAGVSVTVQAPDEVAIFQASQARPSDEPPPVICSVVDHAPVVQVDVTVCGPVWF